jgi:muconolactone delta-isomerase
MTGIRFRLRAEIAKTLAEAEKLKAETRSAEETWRKLWRRPGHDVDRTCC